ncbi:TPA: hypothetical protein ACYRK3_000081 [Stenotrophomonas maltophilia]|nr:MULTISPECIES: hypothetical protein [Stenotrophomonas]
MSELVEKLKAIRPGFDGCKERHSKIDVSTLQAHREKRNALGKA